jgi:predicted pyridoxine 5'-phosphate oxidase superfamily flavin-nucleotide-binding protein
MRNALIGLPLLALAACSAGHSESRDAGPDSTRTFQVGAFSSVSLEGSDNVRVVRGATSSVVATGPQRVLDLLNIRVERNTLKIDRKTGRSNWIRGDYRGAMITVTMPSITAAGVSGSGDMTVDRADGDSFGAAVEGSGNLKVAAITVKRAQLAAEGSGNLTISGSASDSSMAAEGSGNIEARGLVSQRATIAVEGSGGINATVRERATIAVEGSGDVDVTGTGNCAITKEGSGTARCTR